MKFGLSFLVMTIFAVPCIAQEAATAQPLKVTLETITGEIREAELYSINGDGELLSGKGSSMQVNLADLLSIAVRETKTQTPTTSARLLLAGERQTTLGVDSVTFDGDLVFFQSPIVESPINVTGLQAIVWKDDARVEQALGDPSAENDKVVVNTGDEVTILDGILESITAEKLYLNYEGKSRTINTDKVMAVVLAKLAETPTGETEVITEFTNGERIRSRLDSWQQEKLTLRVGNAKLIANVDHVARLEVRSNRIVFLSDLDPVEIEESTQFAPIRSWQRDSSIERNPLKLRLGSDPSLTEFRRGLGTQSFSRLVFANERNFDRLVGIVGIDAETMGKGKCVVQVRADGIELWKSILAGNQPAVPLDIDVSGFERIELLIEAGEQLDLADHVDWANIRFLKTK